MTTPRTPYFVYSPRRVKALYELWRQTFPQIQPFYAVKCNPHPFLLSSLAQLGTGFDCASSTEFTAVLDYVTPENIIFANPIKSREELLIAKRQGITRMTFDNEEELLKIAAVYPEADLVLRLRVNDEGSSCRFGEKFGASTEEAIGLITLARNLGFKEILGFSFHVGSGCTQPRLYYDALKMCQELSHKCSLRIRLLDLGGGFTANEELLASIGKEVNRALEEWTSLPLDCEIIAEPGRYFAETAMTLHVSIIGRHGVDRIYIDDSIYGSFNNIFFDHAAPQPLCSAKETREVIIYGRTCDSIDKIGTAVIPKEIGVGGRLVFPNMGAYTLAAASSFNGFTPATVFIE